MWKKTDKSRVIKQPIQPTRQTGRWHAVSITPERYCCEAARGLVARRFLAAEAPRLPLNECPSPEHCRCKYRHFEDRRGAPRRKEDISGLRRRDPGEQERRGARPRRESD